MNSNTNIFEQATRTKLRFESAKGELSVESLWVLSLETLDSMYGKVSKALKEQVNNDSFLVNHKKADSTNELRLEILKHVMTVKMEERDAAKARNERMAELELLSQLKDKKHIEKMDSLSEEEIDRRMNELKSQA